MGGIDQHLHITGEARFTQHSFEPNTRIRIVDMSSHPIDFVATRTIERGEPISFDYSTTEWELSEPFVDSVSQQSCKGFKHLPQEDKMRLLKDGLLPEHILRLWLADENNMNTDLQDRPILRVAPDAMM